MYNEVSLEADAPPPTSPEGQRNSPLQRDLAIEDTAEGAAEATLELSHNPEAHQLPFEEHVGGSEQGQKAGGHGAPAGFLTIFSGENVDHLLPHQIL